MALTIMMAAVTAAVVTVVDADRVERLLDEQFLDANGVFLSSNDARPDYENSSMVLGAHLAAMVAKHRATGDPSALRQASRSAQAIFRIYALSAPGGEGFYCKPWGWQYQDQTSSDQYIYAMTGLDDYYPYASAAERAQIADLIPKMTRWWIAHGYKWHYFKNPPFVWQRCRFISFMALAMKYSASPEFSEELQRLLSDPQVVADAPFKCSLDRCYHAQGPDGKEVWEVNPECSLSGFLSVRAQWNQRPENDYANRIVAEIVRFTKVTVASDGTGYKFLERDGRGGFREIPLSRLTVEPPTPGSNWNRPTDLVFGPWRWGGQSSVAALAAMTMIAELSPEAREWTLAQVPQLLKRVVDGKHFTSIEDPFEVFPSDFRRQMATTVDARGKTVRRLRAEPMAEWLWAYWNLENLKRDSGR